MIADIFILFAHWVARRANWFGRKVLGRCYTRKENAAWVKFNLDRWGLQDDAEREVASWHYEPAPEEIPGAPPTDKMQLGSHAKRLFDDPVMRLAFEHVTADLMKIWRETACEDTERREDAYRMLRALDAAEFKLRRFANNAALIAAEQRRKEEAHSRS